MAKHLRRLRLRRRKSKNPNRSIEARILMFFSVIIAIFGTAFFFFADARLVGGVMVILAGLVFFLARGK